MTFAKGAQAELDAVTERRPADHVQRTLGKLSDRSQKICSDPLEAAIGVVPEIFGGPAVGALDIRVVDAVCGVVVLHAGRNWPRQTRPSRGGQPGAAACRMG